MQWQSNCLNDVPLDCVGIARCCLSSAQSLGVAPAGLVTADFASGPPTVSCTSHGLIATACAVLIVQAVLRVIFGYLMAQQQQAIPSISIPLHTVIELTPRPDGTMGVEYIPVPVHLSDASMLTTSMDALPANAAAAVAAAAAKSGSSGGGSAATPASPAVGGALSPVMSPLSPVEMMGLDPAAVAAVGACPFKQDEPQGPAAEVAAAAVGRAHLHGSKHADAAVLIGDGGDNSSSHSTGTGCGLQAGQEDLQHAESLPCYYYVESTDAVGDLPLLQREEIQRMSSCSSGSSLALMQQFSAAAATAASAGCVDK